MDEQNEKFKRDKKDLVEGCFDFVFCFIKQQILKQSLG